MFKKILDSMKESFLKGFRGGFNLSRHGKLGAPKPEDNIIEVHKDLAEEIFSRACMTLNETGIMYPTFFLVKGKAFTPVILDPESFGKTNIQGYATMVMNIADDQNAEAMFFISEQWRVNRQLTDKEIKQFEEGKRLPSLDSDRQEVLSLMYITSKGGMRNLMGKIERSPDNTPFVRDSEWCTYQITEESFFQAWR